MSSPHWKEGRKERRKWGAFEGISLVIFREGIYEQRSRWEYWCCVRGQTHAHTLGGYDELPLSVSSWHHTHAEHPLTHSSLSGHAVCVRKMNVCVLMDWMLGQLLHHSCRRMCVCSHKHIDVQLLVRCPCVVDYAQAKVQLLFHSNAHKSVDCSWGERFSGYLSSSLDVPNMALNPFYYLWGEIRQSFFQEPWQGCVLLLLYVCRRAVVCFNGWIQKLDSRYTLILSWQALCLLVLLAVCCSCSVVSQECWELFCVSQVHSQGN